MVVGIFNNVNRMGNEDVSITVEEVSKYLKNSGLHVQNTHIFIV